MDDLFTIRGKAEQTVARVCEQGMNGECVAFVGGKRASSKGQPISLFDEGCIGGSVEQESE